MAADFILLGALAAAEAVGVPAAALVHRTWKHRPAPGATPYGTGFLSSRSVLGRVRAAPYNVLIEYRYRRDGLPPLNRARRELGLAPLRSAFEQYDRIARVLILSGAAFNIPPDPLPANVRYVGAPVERSSRTTWRSPWPADDLRPLVLVSLSTLPQGQGPLLKRVLEAVGMLPVRALVTLGPSLDRADFAGPPNAVLEAFVPHDAVMPLASAMVTQCGLGTLAKALSVGLPLVCLPLIADQPGNAALVAAHGAGMHLHPSASPAHIARDQASPHRAKFPRGGRPSRVAPGERGWRPERRGGVGGSCANNCCTRPTIASRAASNPSFTSGTSSQRSTARPGGAM